MYKVGIKGTNWVIITDGEEVYKAAKDVRHYSKPPGYSFRDFDRLPHLFVEENRVARLLISQAEFDLYCQSNALEVKGCILKGEKIKSTVTSGTIGGAIGGLIAGPVGAFLGAGISGWVTSGSEFEFEKISSVYSRARKDAQEWEQYDKKKSSYKKQQQAKHKQQQAKYIKKAEIEWEKYHKLRNLNSLDDLTGFEFESAIAGLYEHNGYSVKITKASGDYGVDILAKKSKEILAIQTKRYTGKVGIKAVQEVASGAFYYKATKAIVITNSFFTKQAKKLAHKIDITLINGEQLANMWESYQPNNPMPSFNLQEYERIKKQLKKESLRRAKSLLNDILSKDVLNDIFDKDD